MRELLDEANRPLLEAAAAVREFDAAAIASLRKRFNPELVKAAVDLTLARRKAADKFERAAQLWADPAGVEQATSEDVAAYKAGRMAAHCSEVIDLCCGIGGDAMSFAGHLPTMVIDLSEQRVRMARHNVGVYGHDCRAAVADVTTLRLAGRNYHIDPARRGGGQRLHLYEDYQPGPAFLAHLVDQGGAGAIKLGPGVNIDDLPRAAAGTELEFISRRGSLVQAVLWTKQLARTQRAATLIPGGYTLTGSALPLPMALPQCYLFEVEAAVERAGLLGNLAAHLNIAAVHPALGLLTADHVIENPFLTPFELIEQMPWRPKRVKQWLDAHDAGIIEVKTRGKVVNPDVVAAQLRGRGSITYTVFALRMDQRIVAFITHRLP